MRKNGRHPIPGGRVPPRTLRPDGFRPLSLVPPLATVGICLELGRIDEAMGALLLFGTNFAAITVAACIVFSLSGAAPSRESLRERRQVRAGFVLAVTFVGGEVAQQSIGLPKAATGIFQALMLFLILASDVLVRNRIRIVRSRKTAPAAVAGE